MKILSVFNNKGGVGKTTLTYHLSHALAGMGYKVLMIDADPQCNLTIYSVAEDVIHDIWEIEDPFIDEGMDATTKGMTQDGFRKILSSPRSLHFIVKPTEEGTGELSHLPPPYKLAGSLDRGYKKFCVNGHLVGNYRNAIRSENDRIKSNPPGADYRAAG